MIRRLGARSKFAQACDPRSLKVPMSRFHFFAFALLALPLLTGCPPTLSQSANEGYDRKLAEASRHARAGRYEQASESYAEASRLATRRVDQDEARYRQARTLMRAMRFEEAVAILDKIGDRQPTSRRTSRAVYDAARVRYEYLEQYDQAREGFERVIPTMALLIARSISSSSISSGRDAKKNPSLFSKSSTKHRAPRPSVTIS